MNEARAASFGPVAGVFANVGYVALLVGVTLATGAVVFAGGGPLLAAVPVLLVGCAYLFAKAPLRWSTAVLLVALLAVDDLGENVGQWRTPLAIVGSLLRYRIDNVVSAPGMAVSGMELLVLFLLVAWAHRRATGSEVDTGGNVPSARILKGLVILYVAAVVYAAVHGVARGWSVAPWKVRNLLHPIMLFVMFDAAFRGPPDHALVGRVVVFSAVVRSLEAFVVQRLSIAQTGGKFATATSHGDSVLFAVGAFLVLIDFLERPGLRRFVRTALLLPIILVGMMENERRLVWVMFTLMLGVVYLVAEMRGWKRALTRFVLAAVPAVAVYVAVGWDSDARFFKPIHTLRGVADTSYDHSAYWREVENWNIAVSMRERPLLGLGLGGRYTEHMFNDDISSLYPEYRDWPHNTVLGLLLLLGLFAFTAVWYLAAGALFLAMRSYRCARTAEHRVAALGCVGALVACHVLGYGDTGAHYDQYKIVYALALVVAGKLAVATGAWPARRPVGARHGVDGLGHGVARA